MKNYYIVNIEFLDIEFENCNSTSLFLSETKTYNAQICIESSQIEIKIFFDQESSFADAFTNWARKNDFEDFGQKVKLSNEDQNDRLLKIDLSTSKLLSFYSSTSYFENGLQYIKLLIDSAEFFWKSNAYKLNTAEFYLNDAGFKFVKDFYGPMYGRDGDFAIKKRITKDAFYSVEKAEFKPEFNFVYGDNVNNKTITITKEPKLQFKFENGVSKNEILKYGNTVCLLASFYYHIKIDPVLIRIHLNDHSIECKNLEQGVVDKKICGLKAFGCKLDFHQLMEEKWQLPTFNNFDKLSKIITLFIQALLVDNETEFIIRYNIIEICNDLNHPKREFTKILNRMECDEKYKKALDCLLTTINSGEHKDFKDKWSSISGEMKFMPMKSQMKQFFESQNLDISDFNVTLKELIEIRNNIIHGSISRASLNKLKDANKLLYRINGILILNLIGINQWELIK